jgi:DNA invertase Pin-like site-specific DNA recombinase
MAKRAKTTETTRAVIYLRVSTGEQVVSGLGLAAQEAAARRTCEVRGWEVVAVVADAGVSGTVEPLARPAMAEAVNLLCTGGGDVLVASKLDRLSRSAFDLLGLVKQSEGCGFGITTSDGAVDSTSPVGRFITTAMAGVAELERALIAERTRNALAAKKAAGARLGRPVTLPPEVRQLVADMRREGSSLAVIADRLNSDGHRNGTGGEFTRSSVQKIVTSLALDTEAQERRHANR